MSTPLRADWRASVAALALGAAAVAAALVLAPSVPDQEALYRLGKPGHDDNPTARVDWEIARLADPETGVIPADIRERELAFAQVMPARRTGGADWALRGPANLGGRTRALGVDVADPEVVIAGGVSGGMWRSTDGGASWTKTSGPLQLQSVTALAQDTRPGRTETWYYGTGEYRGNSAADPGSPYRGDGLFKSTDNGQSWVPLDATVSNTPQTSDPFDYVFTLAIDPSNTEQDELYAATWRGIYRSEDGGVTWAQTLPFPSGSGASGVAVGSDGRVYAALDAGAAYWRSDDGISWTDITPDDLPGNQNRTVIAVAPSDPSVVYFYGDHAPAYFQPNGVFYRYDADADVMENRSSTFMAATGGVEHYIQYCIGLGVHPRMPDVVYVAGVNLYRSDDGFTTSAIAELGNGHADNHLFAFDGGDPLRVYVGSDGGVHRTDDLFSDGNPGWQERTTGYTTSQFYHLALDPYVAGERLLGGTQDNGSWLARSDDPADWVKLQGGDGAYSAFTATPFQYIVSYQNGSMQRRTFNATGSQIAAIDITPPTSGFQFIHPFSIDPVGRRAFYTFTGNDVWRNPDITAPNPNGAWSQIANAVSGSISTVDAAHVPAERVWVGTSGGNVYRIDDALADEPAVTRVDVTDFPNGYVNQIVPHPTDPNEALVVFSNYGVVSLWRTVDAGATWESVAGNLEENPNGSGAGPSTRGAAILAFAESGPRYFVATSTGLYSTYQMRGPDTVWELEAPDTIGNLVVDAVEARSVDGVVALATHGGGMFSAAFAAPPVSSEGDAARTRLTVGTPYPNPSAGRATVAVRAGEAGPLRVELFDVRGRRLSVLHDGPVAAGAALSLPLGGEGLPAGRYVLRATAGDAVETAFATLVR